MENIFVFKGKNQKWKKFDLADNKIYFKDQINKNISSTIGAGISRIVSSSPEFFLKYDEIQYIIKGSIFFTCKDEEVKASKSDTVFLRKGNKVKYTVEDEVIFFYCTYPVNWDELYNS